MVNLDGTKGTANEFGKGKLNARLSKKQIDILKFINEYAVKEGYMPSLREIANNFSLKSPSSILYHLKIMEEKGHLTRRFSSPRAIEVHPSSSEESLDDEMETNDVNEVEVQEKPHRINIDRRVEYETVNINALVKHDGFQKNNSTNRTQNVSTPINKSKIITDIFGSTAGNKIYDVIIIGAGIIGTALAHELGRYKINTLLLEKTPETAAGTTKANSAIIHAGFDPIPGTLKAKLNVIGHRMWEKLASELGIPYKQNGSLVVNFSEKETKHVKELINRGTKNGAEVKFLTGKEVLKLEPNLNPSIVNALWAPKAAICSPYEAAIAFAENAATNGVEIKLSHEVTGIKRHANFYSVTTKMGKFEGKLIINAAGLYADDMNNLVSNEKRKIIPRKGEYLLFDRAMYGFVNASVFQLPTAAGKGVLVSPTVHNNILLGPSSETATNKTSFDSTPEVLDFVYRTALKTSDKLPNNQTITSFSGLRANVANSDDDFMLYEPDDAPNFINALNINSPGLAAAPAIARYLVEMIGERIELPANLDFNPVRYRIPKISELTADDANELLATHPEFAHIICRCEGVTEGEIVESIRRVPGATTVDAVKRCTRAGMGRCQGEFCAERVVNILARELHVTKSSIKMPSGPAKYLVRNGVIVKK
ncbi:MAG: FAD-dependent oxidoreductase [Bifidobacteriaceae bacterium]|jgi:glycerol-3-phosphate dehydrogenase|nr:FAD-dependent oxidoreductase [Bifidobacteriaceae bacterium]